MRVFASFIGHRQIAARNLPKLRNGEALPKLSKDEKNRFFTNPSRGKRLNLGIDKGSCDFSLGLCLIWAQEVF